MNVAVIGATGMAGSMVTKYLEIQGHTVHKITRTGELRPGCGINIMNAESLTKLTLPYLKNNNITHVINCVGLLVKDCNDHPSNAIMVNSWFPQHVSELLSDTDIKFIHLSTDCIFDGKEGPYAEDAIHTEQNFYGRAKSLGEVNNDKDITFRMSIIGPEKKEDGIGLLHWFLNKSDDVCDGWENAEWNGITTLELAKAIDYWMSNPEVTGIYNLVPESETINKYDLLCKFNEVFETNKTINKVQGPKSVNKVLLPSERAFGYTVSGYDKQLSELKQFMENVEW